MRPHLVVILGAALCSGTPAFACRCRVADTPEKQAAYVDGIAGQAHLVALGRFAGEPRNGARRFTVGERVSGSRERQPWVFDGDTSSGAGRLIYSGSCAGVEAWESEDRVLVLRRREEREPTARAYVADACATRFLAEHPDALARLRARHRR